MFRAIFQFPLAMYINVIDCLKLFTKYRLFHQFCIFCRLMAADELNAAMSFWQTGGETISFMPPLIQSASPRKCSDSAVKNAKEHQVASPDSLSQKVLLMFVCFFVFFIYSHLYVTVTKQTGRFTEVSSRFLEPFHCAIK